jgi:hypothetical protein
MRKLIPIALSAAFCAAGVIYAARAQGIDPGIAAVVSALKATLTNTPVPATVNGWSPFLDAAQGTTVTTVKSSAGELGAYHCLNPNAAVSYIQLFDTSGAVTLGSTVPVLSLGLPRQRWRQYRMGNGHPFRQRDQGRRDDGLPKARRLWAPESTATSPSSEPCCADSAY